jgi:hypothetical protein
MEGVRSFVEVQENRQRIAHFEPLPSFTRFFSPYGKGILQIADGPDVEWDADGFGVFGRDATWSFDDAVAWRFFEDSNWFSQWSSSGDIARARPSTRADIDELLVLIGCWLLLNKI